MTDGRVIPGNCCGPGKGQWVSRPRTLATDPTSASWCSVCNGAAARLPLTAAAC